MLESCLGDQVPASLVGDSVVRLSFTEQSDALELSIAKSPWTEGLGDSY